MFGFLKNIGPTEWGLIALILVIFFGAKIVTGMGKAGGETLKEIKKIKKNFTEAIGDDDTHKDQKEVSK
jgi:Sec-independent protein translocase protein TatA